MKNEEEGKIKSKSYLDQFLGLRCSTDILDATRPITSGVEKEISEAMGVVKNIREAILSNPNECTLIDLCSGNALIPIITSYLLPIKKAIAIDSKRVMRNYTKIKKFEYIEMNIFNEKVFKLFDLNEKYIITSCHCCKNLSIRIIDVFNQLSKVFGASLRGCISHLVMVPCCEGKIGGLSGSQATFLQNEMGRYSTWVFYLSTLIKGNGGSVYIKTDHRIRSEKNKLIVVDTRMNHNYAADFMNLFNT